MSSLLISALLEELHEFRSKLIEHHELWGRSLGHFPAYPVRNLNELTAQTEWLTRKLGSLRPYIERFDKQWLMIHPATAVRWDALEAAVSINHTAQAKRPALRQTIDKLNTIAGTLEALDQDDLITDDPSDPVRSGLPADRIMPAYLPHLHPFVGSGCSRLFIDGYYTQAIEESAKAVFQYLRNVTGLANDGSSLAETAFSVKTPHLAFSDLADETKRNEQIGFMQMLCGFAKGVRNPLTHTHGKVEEAQKAFEYLVLASLFCRRIDDASGSRADENGTH